MLADELIADRFLPQQYVGVDKLQAKIASAQKFCLAADFATAADGLVNNFRELEKITPYCRLPYPLCWFEFAQADRKHWMEAPIHYPGLQGAPHRVGFLTEALGDLGHWRTTLAWSLKNYPTEIGTPLNFSPMAVVYNTNIPRVSKFGIAECVEFELAEFDLGLSEEVLKDYLDTLVRSDWAGEIRYLIAILGMLNARNVSETEKVEFIKLNKQRRQRGKLPLSTHTVLKIRPAHKPSLLAHANGSSGRSAEIRAHFVRGHFKTRRSGVFWWGPHMRGKLELGYVTKDYEVTT